MDSQTSSTPYAGILKADAASKHIPELDGIRGLAILVVTLYRFSREIPTDSTVGTLIHSGLALGERGVELFFVLSGFLITGVLLDARGTSHGFRYFIARRSLRIFPLYFATLGFCVVFLPWLLKERNPFEVATEQQFYLWTYLTNIRMSWLGEWCFGRLDHFWSLSVEEHFYLIWPLIVFAVPTHWLFKIAIVGAIASASSRMVFAATSNNGIAPEVLSCFRMDSMLIGAMLVLYLRSPHRITSLDQRAEALLFGSLIISMGASLINRRLFTIAETLWPITFALLIMLVLDSPSANRLPKLFRMKFLRAFGKYSYAMYVFQNPLIPIVALFPLTVTITQWMGGQNSIAAQIGYMIVMFMLTFVSAVLSWHLYEKHFLKLKRLFSTDSKSVNP